MNKKENALTNIFTWLAVGIFSWGAYLINWLGYRITDGQEDELSLRKLIKKIIREEIYRGLNNLTDDDMEYLCQADNINEVKKELRRILLRHNNMSYARTNSEDKQ